MKSDLDSITSVDRIVNMLPVEEIQHMRRVGTLVDQFTRKLWVYDFFEESSESYRFYGKAALYHDVGKVWIPSHILLKPGRLTDTETCIMYQHPVYAQKLFEQMKNGTVSGIPTYLLQLAMESAVYHHEWWNGRGYPYNLKYEAIPLIARITSVCDAYDAMTSNRVYRKGHSHQFACQELLKCAGTQFDPRIVNAFLEIRIDFTTFKGPLLSF